MPHCQRISECLWTIDRTLQNVHKIKMGCGASMSDDYEANKSRAHVLVVGGGFGGASCCQQLHRGIS